MVINTLNSKEESLASYGHFLEVVLPSLVSFSSVSFSHVPRVGNNIAYNLTKYARNVSGLLIWMKDVPSHLHAIFVADYGWFSLFSLIKFRCLASKKKNFIIWSFEFTSKVVKKKKKEFTSKSVY